MSVRPDTLDKDEHARILRERIIPNSGLADATSQEHPKAVILAGQSGEGKGNLASAAGREFHGDVVSIDPVDLATRWAGDQIEGNSSCLDPSHPFLRSSVKCSKTIRSISIFRRSSPPAHTLTLPLAHDYRQ